MKFMIATLILCATFLDAPRAASAVTIDWAPVGNPGNAADTTGFGAVAFSYSIDKYEVTNAQYAAFLNSVAATDTYGVYNSNMGDFFGGLTRSGSPGGYSYGAKVGYDNLPVNYVSWGDAARFANWLANGQPGLGGPAVLQDASSTEAGSYALNGAITDAALIAISRQPTATVVIPSEDEWYKAAYYDPATNSYFKYPTSSNADPSNSYVDAPNHATYYNNGYTVNDVPHLTAVGHFSLSASPYGTFDQGGNIDEWNEAITAGSLRYMRGGSAGSLSGPLTSSYRGFPASPASASSDFGFRVATVPEPNTAALAAIGFAGVIAWRLRRRLARAS